MSELEFRDYEVEVIAQVTSTSKAEAEASLARSGLIPGALVGEVLLMQVDIYDDSEDELIFSWESPIPEKQP